MNIICESKEINYTRLKVKKPYQVYLSSIFNITYNDGPLLIQTPWASLPYSYSIYDNKYFSMDILIDDESFLVMYRRLIKFIYSVLKMDGCFGLDENKLRLKNENVQSIAVFNNLMQKINLMNVTRFDVVKVIFQIDKFISKPSNTPKQSELSLKVIQIMKKWQNFDLVDKECLIRQQQPLIKFKPPPPPPKLPPPPPPPIPPSNQASYRNIAKTHQKNDAKKVLTHSVPTLDEILSARNRLNKISS